MTDPTWTDIVGAVGGMLGVAIAAGLAVWTMHRALSQDDAQARTEAIAQESLETSREAVAAARDSAESSRRSAEEAATLAKIEVERHHRDLGPTQQTIQSFVRDGHPSGYRDLFGKITVPRDYRVWAAVALSPTSTAPLGLPLLLRGNETYEFVIENWPPDRTSPQAEAVLLKLWPPVDDDPVEQWTCDCGRPLVQGRDTDRGHWDVRLPIEQPSGPLILQGPLMAD